jgi:hypothetical protein
MNTFITSENIRSRMLTDTIKWIKNSDCQKNINKYPSFRRINLCLILNLKITTRNPGYLFYHGILQVKGKYLSNILKKNKLKSEIKRRENWNRIKIVILSRSNPVVCALLHYLNWQFEKISLTLPLQLSPGGIRYD